MKISHILAGIALGVTVASGAAMAQAPAAAPAAPAAQAPAGQPEVKNIGDWIVRCFPINSPSPCDMFQELDAQQTRQRVLSISIAFIPSLDRHAIQVSVPLEVSIPKGLVIQTDAFTSKPLPFRRCDRQGCYVEMPIDNGAIANLSKSGPDGKVIIVADSGKTFPLKFSLKGFAAAHDSMSEQARAKAKAAPAAPAPAAPAPAAPAPATP
jgi:invasion protein IalB